LNYCRVLSYGRETLKFFFKFALYYLKDKNQETETKQNHNIKCGKCQANLYSIFMVYSVQDLLRINYTSLWITLRIYKQQTHTTHDE